ncbi:MAG TPA: DUF2520 domain-containing protein [Bacteroides sp.]|nr:DUF2520 domain-containing protein [Bacteroides sp.]
MATHLALNFQKSGYEVTCIYSRSENSAERLADRMGTMGTGSIKEVPREAGYYLLCVPDTVVPEVSRQFAGYRGIWLHCAGALPLDVLSDHERYGVLYPLQTFSRDHAPSLSETPFLVEGCSGEVTGMIRQLAGSVSASVYLMDTPSRLAVHLAGVFANNFTNHMVHIAQQILEDQGIDRQLITPILNETFQKLSRMKAAEAQTGPATRNDRQTMDRHLEMLKVYPEWEKLYTFISRDIRGNPREKKE